MNSKHFLTLLLMPLSVSVNAADMAYMTPKQSTVKEVKPTLEGNLMNWTSMSVEAFGYDIYKTWRFPNDEVWSWSLAISQRLNLVCDIRPHAPVEQEVYTFGGLAFSR
jgi:hypothetical protein